MPVTGAIIGLGNIGFGFNADGKRSGVWTHERAFARSGEVELVAAADPDESMRRRFAEARPEVPVFATAGELLRDTTPDLVSICAPTSAHARLAKDFIAAGTRAVFCEKPIAADAKQALELIHLAKKRGATLAVNHTRRWDPAYRRAAGLVAKGGIGAVRSVSARYSGHVYNVGTHLIDCVRMLTGLAPEEAVGASADPKTADPHVSGLLLLEGGICCTLACHGKREDLLFELDVVGSEGRLRLVDNGATTLLERFRPSRYASGYRELVSGSLPSLKGEDRFVAAVKDLCACLSRPKRAPACSGEDGYYALAAAQALAVSARQGSRPVKLEAPWKS